MTILYVYPTLSSFVRRDIDYLGSKHDIKLMPSHPRKKWLTPFMMIGQMFRSLFILPRADVVICQFAGYHSIVPLLFATLFRVPRAIIASGTESANFPQIDYGNYRKKWLGMATCLSFKLATHVSPVHSSLIEADYVYSKEFPKKQGIKNHCPGVEVTMIPIPYGFDSEIFRPSEVKRVRNSFVTMAFGIGKEKYRWLKGVDLIIKIAPRFPDCNFILIGADGVDIDLPPNIQTANAVPIEEVPKLLSQYEFYLQLSISEGFPNALCESMLCGCIPIGSCVTSIPEIISDTGFILNQRDPDELESVLNEALNSDKKKLSTAARERIIEQYPASRRKRELLLMIDEMINGQERIS